MLPTTRVFLPPGVHDRHAADLCTKISGLKSIKGGVCGGGRVFFNKQVEEGAAILKTGLTKADCS